MRPLTSDELYAQALALADANEPTYCYCKRISYGEMIACDNPECPVEWFHFGCINLTPENRPKGKREGARCVCGQGGVGAVPGLRGRGPKAREKGRGVCVGRVAWMRCRGCAQELCLRGCAEKTAAATPIMASCPAHHRQVVLQGVQESFQGIVAARGTAVLCCNIGSLVL
jgi:hypothetical protein